MTDGYKISDTYEDSPMDLSNYMLLRVRERMLLESKMASPSLVMKAGKHHPVTRDLTKESLKCCKKDIEKGMVALRKVLYVSNENIDLPVAFASNAIYVLERNGGGETEDYQKVLLPTLRNKMEYLHAEGVAQAVWGLAHAKVWDEEIWKGLKQMIPEKNFSHTFVKNQKFSAGYYMKHSGDEHFFQRELNSVASDLFFQGKHNIV